MYEGTTALLPYIVSFPLTPEREVVVRKGNFTGVRKGSDGIKQIYYVDVDTSGANQIEKTKIYRGITLHPFVTLANVTSATSLLVNLKDSAITYNLQGGFHWYIAAPTNEDVKIFIGSMRFETYKVDVGQIDGVPYTAYISPFRHFQEVTIRLGEPAGEGGGLVVGGGPVTQQDVTQHQGALSIGINQVVDLANQLAALTNDKVDKVTGHSLVANELIDKLILLDNRNKGYFDDEAALVAAYPTAEANAYAFVIDTGTIWSWDTNTSSWVDTGASTFGDMAASVYDPQNIAKDAFARANHTGTQPQSTIDDLADDLSALEQDNFGFAQDITALEQDKVDKNEVGLLSDTSAALQALYDADDIPAGVFFYETDTKLIRRSDGGVGTYANLPKWHEGVPDGGSASDLPNVNNFGAIGDGVANDTAAFDAAAAAAISSGVRTIYVPPGRFRIQGSLNALHGRVYYAFKVSVKGAGRDATTLLYQNNTGDNRGFFIGSTTALQRVQRLGIAAEPTQPRAALASQTAGLNTVFCLTPADAANYPVGSVVGIGTGKNIYDADDPLWYFTDLFKVKDSNAGSGMITLDRNIPVALDSGGFNGQTISFWINGTSYSAGAWRKDSTDQIYEALTSGTSNGTGPADDTGVSWKKVCNSRGALIDSEENYNPVIQLITDPVENVVLEDVTIECESDLIHPLSIRNALNSGVRRVRIKGQMAQSMNAAEAASFIYDDVDFDVTTHGGAFVDSQSRAGSFYACRGVVKNLVNAVSGKNAEARGIYMESFTDLSVENSKFYARNPQGANTYAIFLEGGKLRAVNNEFHGFRYPIRANIAAESGFADRLTDPYRLPIARFVEVSGNLFAGMSAKAFRTVGADVRKVYNEKNEYILTDTYQNGNIVQPSVVYFRPFKLATMWWEYVPTAQMAANEWEQVGPYVHLDDEIVNINDFHYVVLAQRAYYNLVKPSTEITTRIRTFNAGTPRFVFALNSANNNVVVSDVNPYAFLTDSDGGGVRYIDPKVEQLQHRILFEGEDGGSVRVMLDILVADR